MDQNSRDALIYNGVRIRGRRGGGTPQYPHHHAPRIRLWYVFIFAFLLRPRVELELMKKTPTKVEQKDKTPVLAAQRELQRKLKMNKVCYNIGLKNCSLLFQQSAFLCSTLPAYCILNGLHVQDLAHFSTLGTGVNLHNLMNKPLN